MAYAPKSFTLYWSNLAKYEDCGQAFLWGRGWGAIDTGGGPGRKKPLPIKKSEHHALLGIAIQYAIERFYNDELWKMMGPADLQKRILQLGEEALKLELARKFIDWNKAPPRDEMYQLVHDAILGYIRTLKAHRFLGPYAKAEVDLVAYIDQYNPVGGRADMIIRRDDTGVTILDGKNSKRYKDPKDKTKLMTYTDPDQLRWYALLYYLCYRQLPNRLGFVFYRYPHGSPVLDMDGNPVAGKYEEGVEWVPFTKDDLKGLAQRAVDARLGMGKEKFEARPSPNNCRMCDYETVCPERQAQKEANRRGPRKSSSLPVLDAADGIVELDLG
jgi:hypothetical protein